MPNIKIFYDVYVLKNTLICKDWYQVTHSVLCIVVVAAEAVQKANAVFMVMLMYITLIGSYK